MTKEEKKIPDLAGAGELKEWWFIELWREGREVLKEFVKHIVYFGLLIGGLVLFHHILELSGLPQEQKVALDKVHFYSSIIALVIFSGSFIIKVLIFEYTKIHR